MRGRGDGSRDRPRSLWPRAGRQHTGVRHHGDDAGAHARADDRRLPRCVVGLARGFPIRLRVRCADPRGGGARARRDSSTDGGDGPASGGYVASLGQLLRMPAFCGYAFHVGFTSSVVFAFLGGSPYVMVELLGPLSERVRALFHRRLGVLHGRQSGRRALFGADGHGSHDRRRFGGRDRRRRVAGACRGGRAGDGGDHVRSDGGGGAGQRHEHSERHSGRGQPRCSPHRRCLRPHRFLANGNRRRDLVPGRRSHGRQRDADGGGDATGQLSRRGRVRAGALVRAVDHWPRPGRYPKRRCWASVVHVPS